MGERGHEVAAAAAFGVLGLAIFAHPAHAALRPIEGLEPVLTVESTAAHTAKTVQTRRVFVNFSGTKLSLADPHQPDDATRNITRMTALAKKLEGYGGSVAQREAILQAVRVDWANYDVVVTDRRPATGDYVMNHVGPNRPSDMDPSILGIAHLDCNDRLIRNDVSFAFHHASDDHVSTSVAMTISQEIAHAFGLEHTEGPADIMFPARGVADPSFVDACAPVVPAQGIGIACTDQHMVSCGAPDRQNSHAELMTLLGPARTDQTPPTVGIAEGMEALAVAMGDDFELAIEADDDVLVDRVVLHLDGEAVAEDVDAPFGWKMTKAESGEYEFYVEAFDMSGNSTMSEPISVYVGVDPPAGVEAATPYSDPEDVSGVPEVGLTCSIRGRRAAEAAWLSMLIPVLAGRRRLRSRRR